MTGPDTLRARFEAADALWHLTVLDLIQCEPHQVDHFKRSVDAAYEAREAARLAMEKEAQP